MVSTSLLKSVKGISTRIVNLSLATIIGFSSLVAATPLLFPASASAVTPVNFYVRTDGSDSCVGTTNVAFSAQSSACAFLTIQSAISAANSGDTINVAAGTYTEAGQIVISKNLTIVGADKDTTIIKPAQDTGDGSSGDARGWFLVNAGTTFNLSNVTLDGTGHLIYMGLYYWGNGTVNNVSISNIKYNESGPDYQGRGMIIKGNVDVTNSKFTQIGRIGVQYFGGSGTVDGNTFTGKGTGNWLDYGVELGNGAVVTIRNNTITNNTGVASSDGSTSAGILVTTYFGLGTTGTITGNTVTGNTNGIAVGQNSSDTSTVTAHQNNLSENAVTGITSKSSFVVDATSNWWGSALKANIQAMISGSVNFSPWYADSGKTTLAFGNTTTPDGSGNPTVTLPSPSVTDTTTSGGTVNVAIPSGIVITGPAGWDGTITLPAVTSTFTLTPGTGYTATALSAISIGAGDLHLTFNLPVKLTFAGLAGKLVGWSQAGVFHQITANCNSATTPTLAAGADCKIDVGADLVVWTKHFTTFVSYTQSPTVKAQTYTVVAGDTLSRIGARAGIAWRSIASLNGISAPYTIYPRQVLRLPAGSTVAVSASTPVVQSTTPAAAVLGESSNPQIGTAVSTVVNKPAVVVSTAKKANWLNWYWFAAGTAVALLAVIYYIYRAADKKS